MTFILLREAKAGVILSVAGFRGRIDPIFLAGLGWSAIAYDKNDPITFIT
ncbi:MAG: hypothetical protein IH598_10505 [Bacteroidales bacterium]|nr:hypothetical protein [Bacteroidales bacterium]